MTAPVATLLDAEPLKLHPRSVAHRNAPVVHSGDRGSSSGARQATAACASVQAEDVHHLLILDIQHRQLFRGSGDYKHVGARTPCEDGPHKSCRGHGCVGARLAHARVLPGPRPDGGCVYARGAEDAADRNSTRASDVLARFRHCDAARITLRALRRRGTGGTRDITVHLLAVRRVRRARRVVRRGRIVVRRPFACAANVRRSAAVLHGEPMRIPVEQTPVVQACERKQKAVL